MTVEIGAFDRGPHCYIVDLGTFQAGLPKVAVNLWLLLGAVMPEANDGVQLTESNTLSFHARAMRGASQVIGDTSRDLSGVPDLVLYAAAQTVIQRGSELGNA